MAEHDPAARELAAAVAAMALFQQVTQQADTKAGTLVTVHVGLAAVVSAQIASVGAPAPTDLPAALFWLASLAYTLTFIVSGYLLVQVSGRVRGGTRSRIGSPWTRRTTTVPTASGWRPKHGRPRTPSRGSPP
ncbi:hypothetical protein [Streptomyces liliifuscus]|uniref:Uncharacterized protein n=1 Tax=Streptomyces liliifuscus TaxID=2797636 RepID=A0A7T7I0B4_9ACTN|nr:hypothetical protein [Streptomyces liliifuscus]QQM38503.1 hypothetical protein JEQ17_02800 [Streptomyces liliifuscus]